MTVAWLPAVDSPLLQSTAEDVDVEGLRLVQRLLEVVLVRQSSDELASALLQEVAGALSADYAAVWDAVPEWQPRWQHLRPGTRPNLTTIPRPLLNEVLDREAGVRAESFLAACLSYADRPNRVLVLLRPREPFTAAELEYGVAAGHYLGAALEKAKTWDATTLQNQRLQAVVEISRQLGSQRELIPLLEHIADQAARLLHCERASIFLWDKERKELVGRPALGLPGNELRIPENTGVVGKAVQTSEAQIVQNVRDDSSWSRATDKSTGFITRSLLCVPMKGRGGECIGAVEVINKTGPFTADDEATLRLLADQTASALDNVRAIESLVRRTQELDTQARLATKLVGESPAIKALRGTIERVARTELPVLVLGESGTGKDVVARAVHYASPREQQPYIPVNCAAIAETLLESELFGHEKGAFTDAHATRPGKFEAASGGTLFLDEIGDLSAGGQAKLLRVLEEKVVYRVGGTQPIPVDTRIVAATNRDLNERVRAGKFREDLFYRLTVVTLDLPPLRERREDVLVLAEHFLQQFCQAAGRKALRFTADARKRLEQHDWPGNVRELRNLLERVAYLCPHDKIDVADLAFILRPGKDGADRYSDQALADATDSFQRDHIEKAIARAGRNMSEAAKLLGLHRPNLYRKMKLLGMETDS